ncbi:MBG domain-containing protein [Mucilaginibacter lacusdianchii]|uniref:MBG domain-containing protein n=1 Tax=Mucilaginibacter lacusdianchii TaxID=2684211 RepID=UPI00131A87B3|nr:MBG domain-containing protein [Mucilaginibacter sp. JXJ CY 39]
MRKFYPVNLRVERLLKPHPKIQNYQNFWNGLFITPTIKPHGWSLVLLLLLLSSGIKVTAQTTTNFNTLPAVPVPLYRESAVSTASYAVEGFVFTTVNASPPNPSTQIIFSRQTKSTNDYVLRTSATTVGVGYVSVKKADGSAFKLGGFDFRFAMLTGTGTTHSIFTLTGYKGGSPVANGSVSVNGLPPATYFTLSTSAASGFNDIDEFRYTMQGGTGQTSYIDIDNIVTGPANVAAATAPTVTTAAVTTFNATTATLGGDITSDGGSAVTEKGIVWSTATNPTTANNKVNIGAGAGSFNKAFIGPFTPNTTIYVKAYAINAKGTSYGDEISFKTNALAGTSAVYDFETASGTYTGFDTKTLTATNTASSSSITVTAATDGVFRSSTNGSNTAYFGEEGLYFGWNAQETAFTVAAQNGKSFDLTSFYLTNENNEPTSFLISSAKGSITVAIPGGSPIAANFIDISGNANAAYFKGIKSFTVTPSIPAFMEFDHMVIENIQTAITTPTVTTASVTALSATAATLGGNVTADGGASVTERGIVYGTSSTPAIGGLGVTKAALGSGMGAFSVSATGLASSTTYYVRAYAINSVGTVYGEQQTFTTPAASNGTNLNAGDMAVTAWSAANNTVDVVTLKDLSAGTIVNFTDWGWSNPNGAWAASSVSSIGEGNIKWTLSSAVSKGSVIRITYTNGANITLKNLTTNTAIAAADLAFTGYGNVVTDLIINTGDNFFIYQGESTNPNFIFGFNNTISSSPAVDATGWVPTGNYTTGYAIASNLPNGNGSQNALTNGINAIGFTSKQTNVAYTGPTTATDAATWLSRIANVNNWTQQGTTVPPSYESANKIIIGSVAITAPTVSTISASGTGVTTATIAGNVTADGGAAVTERGVVYGTSVNPAINGSGVTKVADANGGTGPFSEFLTGLTGGTTYHVRAYATNSEGVAYGDDQTFTTAAPSLTSSATALNAFNTTSGTASAAQSFTVSGSNLTSDITVTAPAGFEISKTSATAGFGGSLTLANSAGTVTNTNIFARLTATASGSPAGNITVVSTGATSQNIAVSGTVINAPVVTSTSASASGSSTATVSGSVTSDGGSPITERGFVYSLAANPTIGGSGVLKYADAQSSTGTYSANLTNLAAGSNYYIRAYAINSAGTSYGSELTFITIPAPTTTVVSITRADANPSNANALNYTVTFADAVTGVDAADFTLTTTGTANGTIGVPTGSGKIWTVPVTAVAGDGTMRLDFTGATSINPNASGIYTAGQVYTVDHTAPTAIIASSAGASGSTTSTSLLPFTVTFSESVTGFTSADITITNGTLSGFTGSGTNYTFNVTATANGAVTVNVPANGAQDAAGNGNTASNQFTINYTQAVTAAAVVTAPANGSLINNDKPVYTGTAPFGATVTVYVDGLSIGTTTATGGNFSLTQPANLVNGSHSVYAKAVISGNAESANSNTNTFIVDRTAPTLAISSNKALLKAGETAIITFTFSEDPGATFTWSGASGDVVVSGGTLSAISGSGLIRTATFTPVAGVNNGTASITVAAGSYADAAGNYGGAGATPLLTFDTQLPPAPVVVTVANGSILATSTPTYSGTAEANSTVTIYVDGASIGTTTVSGTGNWNKTQPAALAAGSHTVYATATDAAGNTSANSNTNTFTIDVTAPVIASVNVPANGTYIAGQNLDFKINFSENTIVSQLGGIPYLSVTLNTGGTVMAQYVSGSGTSAQTYRYTVKATDKDLDGIAIGTLVLNGSTITDAAGNNAVLTLNNVASTASVLVDGTPIVAQTITFNALAAKTYGDAAFDLSASASSGLTVNYTSSNASIASVSGKTVTIHKAGTVTITASQAGNGSYSAAQDVPQTLTINAKALMVTANAQSKTYGAADPALDYSITSGSLVTGDALSGALSREAGENAGTYAIQQGSLTANANYALTFVPANLTVKKAALTATADNQSKIYGQANPVLTVSYNGFVNSETKANLTTPATATTIAMAGSPVGTYTITPSGAVAANYEITYVNGTLTVTAAQPVITFAALPAKTYGDTNFAPGASSTNNTTAITYSSDNTAVATVVDGKIHITGAGSAKITASQAADGNYSAATDVSQNLTVNPRTIAIAATAQSKIYGDAEPALAYAVTSGTLLSGDNFSGALNRITGENVGTYAINQGTLTAGSNYTLTYTDADLTIKSRPVTITAVAKAKAYGEADPELSYSITSGSLAGNDAFTGSLTREAGEAAGIYAIKQGTLALSNNYALTFVGANLTIGQATPVIIFATIPAKTYGDAEFTAGATSTNNTTAITYSSDNEAVAKIANGKIQIIGAGSANIAAMQAADANHAAAQSVVRELVVNKAAVVIAAKTKAKIYGEADPALTYEITAGTLKGSDTFSGSLARESGENVGAYTIKQGTLALNSNYSLTYTGADLSINARAITVATNIKTKTYGEADPALTYTVTPSLITGDSFIGSLTREPGENAGSYVIKQGTLSAGNNYAITYTPANLTITQRAVSIAAAAKTKSYGEVDPALTYSISSGSLANNDVFTGSLTRVAGEAAGTYAIKQGTLALSNNYNLTYVGADLTIEQASQTITFAALPTKIYGDADFAAGATSSNTAVPVTYSSDNLAVATIVNGSIHIVGAGKANITASQAANANYTAAQNVVHELTVSKADITIAAATKIKTYGDADPALTYRISGGSLKGSDAFTGTLTREAGENAGTYAIKQGTLKLNDNYNLTYNSANLTIGTKAITVTAAAKVKTYGEADPALTYSVSAGSLVGTDAFNGSLSREAGENVGTYAIKQGTLALSNNYVLTYQAANLSIGKKAITITANAQSKTYGDADPALTYTVSSGALVGQDTFTGLLIREAGEQTGTYAIKQGTLALNNNYALTYAGNNLIIGKKELVITADNKTKHYGEANPELTVNYSGFVNGEDATKLTAQPVARTAANQNSAVGSYDITVTGAVSDNYNVTYRKGTLTIGKAQLTIAAVNQSKTYGEANPQLTVNYTGFLHGDTKADLSAQPVVTTTGTAQSSAGSYDIMASGAVSSNYDIVYTKGTLTINKAPLTITADNKTRTYGASNPVLTVSYSGFVNNDTQASLSTQPVINTTANATTGVGMYDIIASGAASNNYSIVYNKGVLTITPANLSIVFSRPLQATYGDADLNPGATLGSGEPVVYSSDNTSVATIVNGKVHIIGAGMANITASAPANGNYAITQPVTQRLTVNKAKQTIDFASIPALNRVTGQYDLSVVRASSGLPVSFTVADPLIASLDGHTLKANRIGTTRVTASQEGNANYLAANTVVENVEVNDANGGNEIVVRQAVSPNGDGVNDFLYIEGIQDHPNNNVTVINRNGVKIFEIKGYDNSSRVFDGKSNINNQMQQPGTYFFILQYEGKRKTGWFVLKY